MGAVEQERHRLIEANLPLARRVATRFAGRGESADELAQVGALALVRAVDRCDPARAELAAYLTRCIEGEIRHHLRDRSHVVRVPRAAAPASFVPFAEDEPEAAAVALLADEHSLDRVAVAAAARALDKRERELVLLLFFCDLSQAEAASRLGLSQAHVSRLLDRAISKMRRRLDGGALSRVARAATLNGDVHGRGEAGALT